MVSPASSPGPGAQACSQRFPSAETAVEHAMKLRGDDASFVCRILKDGVEWMDQTGLNRLWADRKLKHELALETYAIPK